MVSFRLQICCFYVGATSKSVAPVVASRSVADSRSTTPGNWSASVLVASRFTAPVIAFRSTVANSCHLKIYMVIYEGESEVQRRRHQLSSESIGLWLVCATLTKSRSYSHLPLCPTTGTLLGLFSVPDATGRLLGSCQQRLECRKIPSSNSTISCFSIARSSSAFFPSLVVFFSRSEFVHLLQPNLGYCVVSFFIPSDYRSGHPQPFIPLSVTSSIVARAIKQCSTSTGPFRSSSYG